MYKVNISNASQNLSWSAQFPSEIESQEWLEKQIGKPHRLPERQVPTYDENGQLILDGEGNPVLETLPAEFTSEIVDITAQVEAENLKQQRIKDGAKARSTCQQVLDFVAGYNIERNLTVEQITQMQTSFGTVLNLLLASRPSSAKALIAQASVDGVIITQELVDECLALLGDY